MIHVTYFSSVQAGMEIGFYVDGLTHFPMMILKGTKYIVYSDLYLSACLLSALQCNTYTQT